RTAIDQTEALQALLRHYEICRDIMHGFDWRQGTNGTSQERLSLLPQAQEHALAQDGGKKRWPEAVRDRAQAFGLAVPPDDGVAPRDDVAFFQAVRAALIKRAPGEPRTDEELDSAVRQIVSRAVAPEGVIDIFSAAGLEKPDISI